MVYYLLALVKREFFPLTQRGIKGVKILTSLHPPLQGGQNSLMPRAIIFDLA